MIKNKSTVSTIKGPQFINLEPVDINPLMSSCQIKVFHLGKNRNGSYIDRDTADSIAKTLRGTPIVAAWDENKQDFGGHGEVMTIEDGEVRFSCKTVPYGFVSPDAEVWYQNYVDEDEFGNTHERTYLCTTGYLWTGQFPELEKVMEEGQPQSMELDVDTMEGQWAEVDNTGVEFFIINDAIFSKLCILGDEVEPCFPSASVENYSWNDDGFKTTLFSMMKDLEKTLKGGEMTKDSMFAAKAEEREEKGFKLRKEELKGAPAKREEEVQTDADVEVVEEDVKVDTTVEDKEKKVPAEDKEQEVPTEEKEVPVEDKEQETVVEIEEKEKLKNGAAEDNSSEDPYLKHGKDELLREIEELRAEVAELLSYRLEQEDAKKDALIKKYHMLSNEDKADVIAHKSEYSLDEIESKLALIYVRNNVDFSTVDGQVEVEEEQDVTPIFSLDDNIEFVPPLVSALREVKSKKLY